MRKASTLLLVPVLLVGILGTTAQANAVSDWSAIANQAVVVNAARPGGPSIVDLTYVHIAMYDAVNAIDRRYSVFAVRPTTRPTGASPEAAAAAAAYTVLTWLFPAQQAFLDATYANYLLGIAGGTAKTKGIAIGTEVGNAFTALRTGDGRNASVAYIFGSGPGVYQLTPGAPAPPAAPVAPWMAEMKPFAIKSPDQFRADGPPNLTSGRWAEDFNETKAYGALNGSLRTPEQTEVGRFYAENPGAQYNRNLRLIAAAHNLSLADTARFFAQLYVTSADALITTWNSKYYYNFWRPVTAIRAGDTDSNAATDVDLLWLPLVTTPAHPEYPAAHGAATGGLAYALEAYFRTKTLNVTLTSTTVPGVALAEHHFSNAKDIAAEIIDARVYGGMHYRTSGEDGVTIGRQVARFVAKHYFRGADDDNDNDDGDGGREHGGDDDRDDGR